jgi:hypothetical protein
LTSQVKGKYVPLTERINECIESKASYIKELEEKKYSCPFAPATNERSKEILKRRDQRLEIEKYLEEDMRDKIRRNAMELSQPDFNNQPKEHIFFGDLNRSAREAWRQNRNKQMDHKYPDGVTEDEIIKNFTRGVARIASRSQSLRYIPINVDDWTHS